ncbi:MAG TPA: hypothetical protein GXZ77_08990 [Papillibacter sp.]|jgi:ribosomal protein L14E/L6E/L27E|nr:hypothetical protein [Papillibacter sp.]
MPFDVSDIVSPTRGHDSGTLLFIVKLEDNYAYLVDGKHRPLSRPKKKNIRHIRRVGRSDCPAAEKIRKGEPLTDSEIRRSLARFATGASEDEGGM